MFYSSIDWLTVLRGIKAGVVNLKKYIARQYGKVHIRCNAVAPGLILTPLDKNNIAPEVLDIFSKYNTPPYHGEPNESKIITGQTIQVEGGHYIANLSILDFEEFLKKAHA